MDIELDQENFMKYMGGEDNKSDQLEGETMLLQQIEDQKSKKDSNKYDCLFHFFSDLKQSMTSKREFLIFSVFTSKK